MVTMERVPRGSARRAEILAGLVELFLDEGFLHFSLDDLAARLRCSKSTLYGVAGSKEQLIAAVVREFFRRATERVEARSAAATEPTERIRGYLEAISAELAPATSAFYSDLLAFPPAREIYLRNTQIAARRVQDLVTEAQPSGREDSAVFMGAAAGALMRSIQSGDLRTETGLGDAAAYGHLADLIVAGVHAVTSRGGAS